MQTLTTYLQGNKRTAEGNSTYPKVAVQWLDKLCASIKVCAWLTLKCF